MKILLKILNYFFVFLGVVFFVIILMGVYLFVADPFGIKPFLSSVGVLSAPTENSVGDNTSVVADESPLLKADQEKTLKSLGIDPATLPSSIDPAMEACFVEKLGAARVNEIKQGGSPSAIDLFKASSCLK